MYCKNCGKIIPENDKFCGNCGAPVGYQISREHKEKAFWRHGWFTILMLFMCFPVGVILVFINHPSVVKTFFMFLLGLIVLCFVLVGFDGCSSNVMKSVPYKSEQTQVESDAGSTSEKKKYINEKQKRNSATSKVIKEPVGKPDQIYFAYKLYDYKVAYNKADNNLQKSAVRGRQVEFLKQYFPNNKFENWIGKVKEINSVENGNFASIEIECRVDDMVFGVATERFNIKLSGKQTLIDANSPLYNVVFNLQKGDTVEFSAFVIPNKESGLYLDNWVSEMLSVEKPEFIVQFTDIKKVDGY
ncbi:MAG: zinc ribbon domain-containing protein [Phascolarctobacterium sp.]|nr:zinc ribbon domain-containing protein [Phascolarctobacterium sp.]